MKKILKITGITLLALLLIAFLVPYLFKGKIVAFVKKEINSSLNAKVDFSDVDISLFRRFPRLSVRLENLYVAGLNDFAGDTLLSAPSIDASVNLFSLFDTEDMKVYGFHLDQPRIQALVNKEGKANWEIAKEDTVNVNTEEDSSSSFKLNIEKYSISDGYLLYNDESSDMRMEITGLDHEGSGDIGAEIFTLATTTAAREASFVYEGIPYLAKAKTTIGTSITINTGNGRYDFKTEDILVNDLKLSAEGFFQLVNDSSYNMDIKFTTPSNEFKNILSLVPAVYQTDFEKLKTGGSASFNGFVKGSYSPAQMPAYLINLEVKDGFFQYPDLPSPVKNIQLAMKVENPDGVNDNLVLDIQKGHLEMDNEPFDFRLLFKNPETAQYVDAAVKGRIDLSKISKFIKLEKGTKLSGLVAADAFAKGNLSAIQQQAGPFSAGGFLNISKLFYSALDFPQPIQNGNLNINLENSGGIADNTSIKITEGHIELGKDPFDFTLQLSKPVSTMDFAGSVKGRFTLDHVKQFMELEPGTSLSGQSTADLRFSGNKTAIDRKQYDQINIAGKVAVANLNYVSKEYPGGVQVNTTELGFNPANIALNQFEGRFMGTKLSARGTINNLIGYVMQDQLLAGKLAVEADKINLNDWMGTDTTTSTSSTPSQPFLVPSNIDFTLNAKSALVKYDKVDYKNVQGTVLLKNETVHLQNVGTEALDGTIAFAGTYSTKENKQQPAIAITYDIKNVDIQKAFTAFNTVQKLMPVGQFLSGKLSSKLTMTGSLGGDLMPVLNSLTGNGNLLLLEGVLQKFKPLESLANTLQIDELKNISIKDIKNYIEFANGKVLVKPFNLKVKDIEMQIGGMHGFDQSMDYIIAMKLPRKYLGERGNALVNGLVAKASSKGIKVDLGETVNLNIRMGGSISNPVISTDLKEVAGDAAKELKDQATDFAKEKIDSAKKQVKDTLNVIKKQVTDDLKDELKDRIFGKDTNNKKEPVINNNTKKKAEETIKNMFKKKKPVKDSTR